MTEGESLGWLGVKRGMAGAEGRGPVYLISGRDLGLGNANL